MKTLTEMCKDKIVNHYSFFKNKLDVLPHDIKEEIIEQKRNEFDAKYQIIYGRIYPKEQQVYIINSDWRNYSK